MEEERAPDFDESIGAIARQLNVPYLPLQKRFDDVASNPESYTDGSHMERTATASFSWRLGKILADLYGGSSDQDRTLMPGHERLGGQ